MSVAEGTVHIADIGDFDINFAVHRYPPLTAGFAFANGL
jgi:hypothetical protein